MIAQRRVPREVGADVDWELPTHPNQLCCIGLDFPNATHMKIHGRDCLSPEQIDLLEILGEHLRVLFIFGGDVLLDGSREGDIVRAAERQVQDMSVGGIRWCRCTVR